MCHVLCIYFIFCNFIDGIGSFQNSSGVCCKEKPNWRIFEIYDTLNEKLESPLPCLDERYRVIEMHDLCEEIEWLNSLYKYQFMVSKCFG